MSSCRATNAKLLEAIRNSTDDPPRAAAACRAKLVEGIMCDGVPLAAVLACQTIEELTVLKAAADPSNPLSRLTADYSQTMNERRNTMNETTIQGPAVDTAVEPDTVSIAGIDKAELLAALYNAARPLGMGFLRADEATMTVEEARTYVSDPSAQDNGTTFSRREKLFFDYLKGRPLKVDLSGDTLRTRLYNRDQGAGKAEIVVAELREKSGG